LPVIGLSADAKRCSILFVIKQSFEIQLNHIYIIILIILQEMITVKGNY
jgi:hypothetical protein